MGRKMSFKCSFSPTKIDYEVVIDDDDRVCYAYLLDAEGRRAGDVWLYNRAEAPNNFDDARSGLPPRNAVSFVADADFLLPKSPGEFYVQWLDGGYVL